MLKEKIKSLIHIIEGTEINELEVSSFWGAQKIRLQKNTNIEVQGTPQSINLNHVEPPQIIQAPIAQPNISTPITPDNESGESTPTDLVEIISPLVGTFYQSAKPESPAFVKEGDKIEIGETICIVEAMKIFNEIEAEVSGEVVKIIVNDSSPVEYGQTLMLVKPN